MYCLSKRQSLRFKFKIVPVVTETQRMVLDVFLQQNIKGRGPPAPAEVGDPTRVR